MLLVSPSFRKLKVFPLTMSFAYEKGALQRKAPPLLHYIKPLIFLI